ncbi:MAG: hypothetical protein NTZ67_04705 [Gammaproteobacteria bacterium]|nr:hypothetical protein [Gammaproteobacteria bacterium]
MNKTITFSLMGLSLMMSSVSNAQNCACLHRGGWQGNNTYFRCEQNSCLLNRIPNGSTGAVWTVDNTVNFLKQGVDYVSQPDGSIACPKAYRHANPGIATQCQNNKAEVHRNGLPQCAFPEDWKPSENNTGEYSCDIDKTTTVRCAYDVISEGVNLSSPTSLELDCATLEASASPLECAKCFNPL